MKKLFLLGGDGGIGSAICKQFENRGFIIIAPDIQECDLSRPEAIETYLASNASTLKDVSVVIHSAGINNPEFFDRLSMHDIERVLQVNTLSFVRILQHFSPILKKQRKGYVLAISSLYGTFSRAGRLPYALSKHGLNGVVKTVALELAPYNILANTLSPGFVDTPLTRKNNSQKVIRGFEERIPLGRLASVNDIARTAYYLCSPDNTYISGQDITVDGGYSAGGFQK